MNPVDFPEANRVFTAPEGMTEDECKPLRALDNGYELTSRWAPDGEELARLAAGAPVLLTVLGRGHPPVRVGVGAAPAPAKPSELVVPAAVEADLAAFEEGDGRG